jgi:uroporphyrinogen-III synthase
MIRPRVLNTRPREQAAELSRFLARAGFEPIEAPAIDIVPQLNRPEFREAERSLKTGGFDWVILSSQNAAHPFNIEDLGKSRVVCGRATARALGIEPELGLDRFSASAALEVLRPLARHGQRALVPRGADDERVEIQRGLRRLGVEVTAPVVYSRGAVDDADRRLRAGGIDVVTVCSPSAVQSLVWAIRDTSPQVPLVCLGETTAGAARNAGFRVSAVAEQTSMSSLVQAVENALAAHGAVA